MGPVICKVCCGQIHTQPHGNTHIHTRLNASSPPGLHLAGIVVLDQIVEFVMRLLPHLRQGNLIEKQMHFKPQLTASPITIIFPSMVSNPKCSLTLLFRWIGGMIILSVWLTSPLFFTLVKRITTALPAVIQCTALCTHTHEF